MCIFPENVPLGDLSDSNAVTTGGLRRGVSQLPLRNGQNRLPDEEPLSGPVAQHNLPTVQALCWQGRRVQVN